MSKSITKLQRCIICNTSVVLFFLLTNTGIAQQASNDTTSSSPLEEWIVDGNKLLSKGFFIEALPIWLNVVKEDPTNADAYFKAAICYRNSFDEQAKALPYLRKAVKAMTTKYNFFNKKGKLAPYDALYFLGTSYLNTNKPDSALENFLAYKNKFNNEPPINVDKQIMMCVNAQYNMKKPRNVSFNSLAVLNTSFSENNPAVSIDGSTLYFSSRRIRKDGSNSDILETKTGKHYEDIYVSKLDNKKEWQTPQLFIHSSLNANESPLHISSDKNTLYFSKETKGITNIYYSLFKDGVWEEPKLLDANINSSANEIGLSMTVNDSILVFASDRVGGKGKTDIYICKKGTDGKWGRAQNIGDKINTLNSEIAPFISPKGDVLYFSSNGNSKGMGGYDIYMSALKEDGTWSTPQNLGFPINTSSDEIHYNASPSGLRYYSHIDNNNSYDIFQIIEGGFDINAYKKSTSDVVTLTEEVAVSDVLELEKEVEKEVEITEIVEMETIVEKEVEVTEIVEIEVKADEDPEVFKARAEIAKADAEKAKAEAEIKKADAEKAQAERAIAEAKMQEGIAAAEKAKAEAEKIKAEATIAEAAIKTAEAEKAKADAVTAKANIKIAKINKKAAKDSAKVADAKIAVANAKIAEVEKEKLVAETAKAEAQKAEADKKIAEAEALKLKAEADKKKAEADLADVEKAKAEATAAKEAQTQAESKLKEVTATVESSKAEAEKAKAEVLTAKANADKAKEAHAKAELTAKEATTNLNQTQADLDKVKAELAATKESYNRAVSETDKAKAEIEALKTAANQAKTEIEAQKAAINQAKANTDKAIADKSKAEEAAKAATTKADQAQADADKAKTEALAAKAATDKAQAEATQAKAHSEKALADKNAAEQTAKTATAETQQAKAALTKAETLAKTNADAATKAQTEAQTAKANADKANAEIEKLKKEIDKLKADSKKK